MGVHKNSVLYSQIFCRSKAVLKLKVYFKRMEGYFQQTTTTHLVKSLLTVFKVYHTGFIRIDYF